MLLTDEVLGMVGREVYRAAATIDRLSFQHWAAAVGDLNPVYFDDAAARAAGYRGVVMPALYLNVAFSPINSTADLNPDGSRGNDPMESLTLPVTRLMAAGESVEILDDVYPDEMIEASCRIASIAERSGGSGDFVVVDYEWLYRRSDGEPVARSTTTIIVR